MDHIERMFRILVGKHALAGEKVEPGINSWNIEIREDKGVLVVVFHCEKPNIQAVDIKDLEIISNMFFTKNLNIGTVNKVKDGCKTCNAGSDHELPIWINEPGFKPTINKAFMFSKHHGTKLPSEQWYYGLLGSVLRAQCIEEFKANESSLGMV